MSAKYFHNNWHSSSPEQSATLAIYLALCCAGVGIRVGGKLCRESSHRYFQWDDYIIFVALLVTSAGSALLLWSLTKGDAQIAPILVSEGKYADVQKYFLAIWIGGLGFITTLCLIRLSILVFYHQIFGFSTRFRKVSIGLGVANILWALGAILGSMLVCKPISHNWDPLGEGKCVQPTRFNFVVSVLDIVLDAAFLILPLPYLIKLRVSRRTRFAIGTVLCIGVFAVVSNILRLRYLYQPERETKVNLKKALMWTLVHVATAFMCACLLVSKPLFIRITAKLCTLALKKRIIASLHNRREFKSSSENQLHLDLNKYEAGTEMQGNVIPSCESSEKDFPRKTNKVANIVDMV